jgi:thiol-disulfide isomerase/thioredoxin
MKKWLSTAFIIISILCCGVVLAKKESSNLKLSNIAPSNLRPFTKDAFAQLKQEKLGEQWLIVLWSLDCPACFKELKLIQALQQSNKNKALNVIFINADDNYEVAFERKQVLAYYDMLNFTNFYFVDGQGGASRYQIDPQWYGELPRSYFVDQQGKFHGKSGLLDESLIRKWLIEK